MTYKAVIETKDYKDFKFFEDDNGKYIIGMDNGATEINGWIPLYFTECEQEEPVLDKIRAEIEQYIDKEKLNFGGQFDRGLNFALKIIDKYKYKADIRGEEV